MPDNNPLISKSEREKTSLEISRTLHAALYELVTQLEEEEGTGTNRSQLMCALVFAAVSDTPLPVLTQAVRRYRRARVDDIPHLGTKVVPIRLGRPRGQKTG